MPFEENSAVLAGPQGEDSKPDEEKLLEAQRRSAREEQAQRAREQFENQWEGEVRKSRATRGLCVLCGRPHARILRLFGFQRHPRCTRFTA